MYRMTSSLRIAPLAETLAKAQVMAERLGIVRVTDTTWLDCIGVPVFAAIRPDSRTLCVNAGKGVHREEARVGAYMEAIEFARAEPRNNDVEVVVSTPRAIQAQATARFEFVQLCPVLGRPVAPEEPIACVRAHDIGTGEPVLIPAELVFNPMPPDDGQAVFGTGSNGLCSGNSVAEATVHGLFELLERDVRSFNYVRDDSRLVDLGSCGPDLRQLADRFAASGLEAVLRYTPGEFGFPYFDGFVLEPSDDAPITIAHGAGLHLITEIAAVRALAEAAQSRLSFIHGGRDDLVNRHEYFAQQEPGVERETVAGARTRVLDPTGTVRYSDIVCPPIATAGPAEVIDEITAALRRRGLSQALRVVLSLPDDPLAVVRVIVPGLEVFRPVLRRVGPRLARFAESRGDR